MADVATPRVLIVAGSDSGGGAGIQADIKTATMLGAHAMTAVTAITAQNTLGVSAVHPIPADMVVAQMRACIDDIGVDAIKIGMIGSAATANAVAEVLEALVADMPLPIVFDPVMVATSGSVLADTGTIAAFDRLMRVATLVTPNLPELAALGGEATARTCGAILLVKGGHAAGDTVTDRLVGPEGEIARWSDARIETRHTHGTGCTLSTAIACGLARGLALREAVAQARTFVRLSLRAAPGLGHGHGPMGQQAVRVDLGAGARLNQVTLPGEADAATRAFYAALGLSPIVATEDAHYARFEAAGGATLSVERGARPAVYLECEDLDAAVATAISAGVTFETMPEDKPWRWREAWTRDPAGNRLCLYHAGENRRFPPWRLADA